MTCSCNFTLVKLEAELILLKKSDPICSKFHMRIILGTKQFCIKKNDSLISGSMSQSCSSFVKDKPCWIFVYLWVLSFCGHTCGPAKLFLITKKFYNSSLITEFRRKINETHPKHMHDTYISVSDYRSSSDECYSRQMPAFGHCPFQLTSIIVSKLPFSSHSSFVGGHCLQMFPGIECLGNTGRRSTTKYSNARHAGTLI